MCQSFLTPAVYCLVERENVEHAEAKLAAYERSNLQDIIQNEARKVQDSIPCMAIMCIASLRVCVHGHLAV